ncbi:MAG: hypothetical protein ACOC22_00555 [bacterium]
MAKIKDPHNYYLEKLINELHKVDENRNDLCWVMKEGLYFKPKMHTNLCLCDLILGYYSKPVTCIELKGSRKKENHAIKQLYSAYEFVNRHLNLEVDMLKVVYYGNKIFEYKIIDLP